MFEVADVNENGVPRQLCVCFFFLYEVLLFKRYIERIIFTGEEQ